MHEQAGNATNPQYKQDVSARLLIHNVGGMCFMIEVYRSSNQGSSSFDRHSEICRDCAAKEIKGGHYVEFDLYLSERTDSITRDDTCQICEGSFFRDGRKKWERLDGAIY